ncbi:peptidase C13 family-domain-containing protein [Coniella lustricola]|uniref:Peptidase C13 family-domain-containing protein n=1 Tax=Coniella lustricola TaxID=2025994 RepID=A0A2T2ZX14_9PEZI|nr:peptidase C13 family-domain-containing protein [Coniella lustricola]
MLASPPLGLSVLLAALLLLSHAAPALAEHTSNWAVLVCTSRFWFNYRHLANVLSIYRTVKRLGIPDSQIILMLPDDMACNPRNAFPGTVYSNADRAVDLYGDNIEVDYRGYEVTVENFIRLLTDRVGEETPRSKRLLTDDRSNILVYMTGHGGNEFLKFQDAEEIGAFDLADAFEQMWEKKRYHEILFMIDTCQANTMYTQLYSPNIIATGSSELDQSSYSHHADNDVGVAVIDRYTYYNLEFLETHVGDLGSKKTLGDLFDSYTYEKIHSNAGVRYDLFPGGEDSARSRLVTDFFGNVQNVEVDGTKNSTLEEDLLALSKHIAELRQRTETEDDAPQKNESRRGKEEEEEEEEEEEAKRQETASAHKVHSAKPLTDDDWWTKKLLGAVVLGGCVSLWSVGSFLEKASDSLANSRDDAANSAFATTPETSIMKINKIPPLRDLELPARPCNPRALAWSSDAELAVAADDCVLIYVPEFPVLDPARPIEADGDGRGAESGTAAGAGSSKQQQQLQDSTNGDLGILPAGLPAEFGDEYNEEPLSEDSSDDEDDEDEDDDGPGNSAKLNALGPNGGDDGTAARKEHQFMQTYRQLPISYPFLHAELNTHVWEAADLEMPIIRSSGDGPIPATPSASKHTTLDDAVTHPGAGVGVIGSSGASMNHIVAVQWSPAGVGRSTRPVLAVLTGVGSLAVYGEGCAIPFGNTAKAIRSIDSSGTNIINNNNNNNNKKNMHGKNDSKMIDGRGRGGSARNLQSWMVLWAVGENFVVPGQEEFGYGEFIKAFSWSREVGRGRALLAYVNDVRELVVLAVGAVYTKREGDGHEEAVWHVREVMRMEVGGPHEQVDPHDPDFVPSGSSYGVSWGPWIKGEDNWSCVLSYMDRNYVGFKKLTVNAPSWDPKVAPVISCAAQDWTGRCLHLGVDAFLEFEDVIWAVNNKQICRGIIATPWIAESFEIDLSMRTGSPSSHSTDQCGTTYSTNNSNVHHNPITGLVIHPVPQSTVSPSLVPIYTAVRLSATATNTTTWWETNVPSQATLTTTATTTGTPHSPAWATAINKTTTNSMPLGAVSHIEHEPPLPPTAQDGEPRDEVPVILWEDDPGDRAAEEDEEDAEQYLLAERDAHFDPWAAEGLPVHPFGARIWGVAVSPGGGTTAVLASTQMALRPEKASWATRQSRILFEQRGCRAASGEKAPVADADADAMDIDSHGRTKPYEDRSLATVEGMSTEARLWEWMYGGGPDVPNLTTPASNNTTDTINQNPASMQEALDVQAKARRAQIRAMFLHFVTAQTCAICADDKTKFLHCDGNISNTTTNNTNDNDNSNKTHSSQYPHMSSYPDPDPASLQYHSQPQQSHSQQHLSQSHHSQNHGQHLLDSFCENNHRVAVCGASGLAIMEPGISRCCGVCQARSLTVDYLVTRVLLPADRGGELVRELRRLIDVDGGDDVCVRCGGKFID